MGYNYSMKKLIYGFTFLLICTCLFAQEALKSTEEEYYNYLSLTGVVERPTLGYRTLSDSVWDVPEDAEHIWSGNNLGSSKIIWQPASPVENIFMNGIFQGVKYKIFGPEWFNSYNTDAPYGQNDGALWQGRGYNTSLTGGIRFEGYGFEATFKPQISFSQNTEFEYNPGVYGDTHSYNWKGNIDLVQRFGDASFWNYDWGDSEIRWNWHALTLGFGNQSPWLGPAMLNPMLGSNNAASYTKFDAGLRKLNVTIPKWNIDLGNIEGRIWLGKLEESDYFDNDPSNNDRMLTAMTASWQPSFIPGLTLGLNRIFITYWRNENYKYILRLFTLSKSNALASSGNDEDQKFSLFVQWLFPQVGFKFYGEFGRDDFSSNENTNPYHTAIYTAGAQQSIPLPFGLQSEILFEWNNFEASQDFQLQWPYMGFYAHGFVKQGYTQKGQILGAGSGYFGNSQLVKYKVYYPRGYTTLIFHRHSPNNNSIYSKAVKTVAEYRSDFYLRWYANFETYFYYGAESCYFITPDFNITANIAYIRIHCPNYIKYTQSQSVHFSLMFKYTL